MGCVDRRAWRQKRPTLIVFFGDHQPPLTNAFYEQLYGKKLAERDTQEERKIIS